MTHLSMTKGDQFQFDVTVTDGGVAVDLTGVSITASFRTDRSDTTPLFTKTQAAGIQAPTAALGNIARVTIAPADTEDFGRYQATVLYWDIQVTLSGQPFTVDTGTLTVAVD